MTVGADEVSVEIYRDDAHGGPVRAAEYVRPELNAVSPSAGLHRVSMLCAYQF